MEVDSQIRNFALYRSPSTMDAAVSNDCLGRRCLCAIPLLFLETSHEYTATHHHLHPDGRGAAPGHVRFPAHRAQLSPPRRASTSTTSDISVAARVLGEFPEYLSEAQRVPNTLAELGKPDPAARSQHHQAAQHQRLGGPAEGRHQGAAGQGLRRSRLPGRPQDRRRKSHQGPLRQVHRLAP